MANFDRAIKKIIYILFLLRMETLYMESNNAFSEEKEIKETEFLILLAWFFCVTIKLRENKCFFFVSSCVDAQKYFIYCEEAITRKNTINLSIFLLPLSLLLSPNLNQVLTYIMRWSKLFFQRALWFFGK